MSFSRNILSISFSFCSFQNIWFSMIGNYWHAIRILSWGRGCDSILVYSIMSGAYSPFWPPPGPWPGAHWAVSGEERETGTRRIFTGRALRVEHWWPRTFSTASSRSTKGGIATLQGPFIYGHLSIADFLPSKPPSVSSQPVFQVPSTKKLPVWAPLLILCSLFPARPSSHRQFHASFATASSRDVRCSQHSFLSPTRSQASLPSQPLAP